MATKRLDIYIDGQHAGTLIRTAEEEHIFRYREGYSGPPLSLTMPVRERDYVTMPLTPVLQQNLPEGVLGDALRRQFGKLTDLSDEFGMLTLVGACQIGWIQAVPPGSTPPPCGENGPPADLDALLHTREEQPLQLFRELLRRFALYSGVSGTQPKLLVSDAPGRLTFTTRHWIVKFQGAREHYGIAVNEHLCLLAAARAGLPVPEHHISDDGRRLVVRRFDRTEAGEARMVEDFCTLQALTTHGRYNGDYADIVTAVRRYAANEHRHEAYERLFASIVLSMLVRDGDAHRKNFALLYGREMAPRLAPVFDKVTTTVYIANDLPALRLDGRHEWPDRDALVRFGMRHCNLTQTKANRIIDRCAAAVSDTLDQFAELSDRGEVFDRTCERLRAAWLEGLQTSACRPVQSRAAPSP